MWVAARANVAHGRGQHPAQALRLRLRGNDPGPQHTACQAHAVSTTVNRLASQARLHSSTTLGCS